MDPALAVRLKEHAAAVRTLLEVALAAELHGHLAELALPALRRKLRQVRRAELHREVPAAVSAAMA